MDCNCKNDILDKLKDIPYEWAEKIAETICQSIIDDGLDLTCDQIRECETLTELSEWNVSGMSVCIVYKDEKGVSNKRCFSFTDILNLDTLDPKCIVSPSEWVSLGTVGQWQAFIDSLCTICPTTTTTTSSTTTTTTQRPILIFDVCPGDGPEQACQEDCEEPVTIYSPTAVTIGTILYTDSSFTTPLLGVYSISAAGYYYELDILTGEVTNIGQCSEFTSTTTTTTIVASTTTTTTVPPTTTTTTSTTTTTTTAPTTTTTTTTTSSTTTTTTAFQCVEIDSVVATSTNNIQFDYTITGAFSCTSVTVARSTDGGATWFFGSNQPCTGTYNLFVPNSATPYLFKLWVFYTGGSCTSDIWTDGASTPTTTTTTTSTTTTNTTP